MKKLRKAFRRKEEPIPRASRNIYDWLSVGRAATLTRKANIALRRIRKRMIAKGVIKIKKGGDKSGTQINRSW